MKSSWGITVTRKTNGRWEVRWREGPRRISRTFTLKKDADAYALEVARRRQLGGVARVDAGTITLAEFMEDWWRGHAVPNLAPRTREVYGRVWGRHVLPRIGGYALREITPAVVDDLRADLHRAGVGDPTIIKALGLLQGVMKKAFIGGEAQATPFREVDKPRQRQTTAASPLHPALVEAMRARLDPRDATLLS